MIGEQTQNTGEKVELKPSKELSPESLQDPTDPDATYRTKGKKGHIGYVANVVEDFDDNGKIITQYDLKQNTYSDQKFSNDTIDKLGKQEEEVKILVDGAYYSEELANKAKDNNIKLIPTNLVGRSTNDENSGYEKFNIDEETHIVSCCPLGMVPLDSIFKNGIYTAHFSKDRCSTCPHLANCPVSEQKKKYLFQVFETKLHRAKLMQEMETKEYNEVANKRAGVEGIPSILRRRYNIDNLPIRGLVRSKFWLGFKISAINCKRLIKSRLLATRIALFPLFYNHLLEIFSFQRAIAIKIAA